MKQYFLKLAFVQSIQLLYVHFYIWKKILCKKQDFPEREIELGEQKNAFQNQIWTDNQMSRRVKLVFAVSSVLLQRCNKPKTLHNPKIWRRKIYIKMHNFCLQHRLCKYFLFLQQVCKQASIFIDSPLENVTFLHTHTFILPYLVNLDIY